mgnify:CR=1 FL=1
MLAPAESCGGGAPLCECSHTSRTRSTSFYHESSLGEFANTERHSASHSPAAARRTAELRALRRRQVAAVRRPLGRGAALHLARDARAHRARLPAQRRHHVRRRRCRAARRGASRRPRRGSRHARDLIGICWPGTLIKHTYPFLSVTLA